MSELGLITVGKLTAAHGLDGSLKLHVYAESLDLFEPGTRLFLRRKGEAPTSTTVRTMRQLNGPMILVGLDGVTDRTAAERVAGALVAVPETILPEIEDEDTYYWHELIGLTVFDSENRCLGKLAAILETGSNDVYVVRSAEGETLVPALADVVNSIDLDAGTMIVTLPEGL